jgi:hypothetical protein
MAEFLDSSIKCSTTCSKVVRGNAQNGSRSRKVVHFLEPMGGGFTPAEVQRFSRALLHQLTPGPLSARPLIRQQVRVQGRSHGRTVGLQGHAGKTRVAAVKGCVVNPSAKIFIMPQGASYLQPKEARIGIHETWCDAPIAAVPVDQNEFPLSHLPGLLHEFRKDAAPHYFRRMKSMKVDLHTEPPA